MIMKNSTYNESRVVALSLTLPELDINRLDELWDFMEMSALDEVCYQDSYNIHEMAYYSAYVHVIDAVQGHQVIRSFMVELRARYNCMSNFRYTEVCQHWLCPDGSMVVMAKSRRDLKFNPDLWWFGSKMSIKHGDYGHIFEHCGYDFFGEHSALIFVDGIENKLFYHLGKYIKTYSDNVRYELSQNQFNIIFSRLGEYLAKTNNLGILNYLLANDYNNKAVEKRLDQIRIATKHRYEISSRFSDWLVYLDWLEDKNKDLHNPHYICNDALFTKFTAEKKAFEERKRRAEELRRQQEWEEQQIQQIIAQEERYHHLNEKKFSRTEDMALWEEEYAKAKRAYLGIGFLSDDGTIKFHVLQNVKEFYNEAQAMVHCLFWNNQNYFLQEDCIILSATDATTGDHIATIQLNLNTLKVVQIRAKYDRAPERESDIRKAIDNNLSMFKQAI